MLFRYTSDSNGKPVRQAIIYTENEHCIKQSQIDPDALRVIRQLRSYGYQAYIVGGAVRDLLVGNSPNDFDITTDATPSKIKKIFRNSRIIGRRFRLVHIFYGLKIFEVSTFRSLVDGSVGNTFGTLDEDVQRRDFTMNALYYDPLNGHIIDYVGGVKDIKARKIVPVIPLERIFVEDPVRMLRAIKYTSTTGFKMPSKLKRKITTSASLLSPVSPSRLTEELLKIITSGHSYDIVKRCLETELYMYLQPTATSLMFENRKFEESYMKNLRELDAFCVMQPDARLGQKLAYIIYDFIAGMTDWDKEIASHSTTGELYKNTWKQVRNFVLPMNPQRTELEYAIRASLKRLGVSIKIPKNAFRGRNEKPKKKTETSTNSKKLSNSQKVVNSIKGNKNKKTPKFDNVSNTSAKQKNCSMSLT
ncbi:MAG: polynucleotide adenylyltransferase [Treponema sp. CETP13]|nr:MAG: polynucleotide adenylyltransferase [Treponema sp. CETP13]